MLSIVDVSKAIDTYRNGEWTLDQFADWSRAASRRKFAEPPEVLAALLEIDSMLSRIDFDGLSEAHFREELANAVHPLPQAAEDAEVKYVVAIELQEKPQPSWIEDQDFVVVLRYSARLPVHCEQAPALANGTSTSAPDAEKPFRQYGSVKALAREFEAVLH